MSKRSNRYAVLIGVDYYGGSAKTLRGAVSDVEEMHQYLATQGIESIWVLATKEPSDIQSKTPPGISSRWATFENVESIMRTVTSTAKAGDHLLFYFCGHGTQTPPTRSEHSNTQTGDLALVLFDELQGVRYLRSAELAGMLKRLTDSRVSVTVVLDCCHAASIIRYGNHDRTRTRSTKYDPVIDATYPLDRSLLARPNRDARSMQVNLLDPETYTIVAACGPHERADEMKNNGGGALSYFLMRTLRAHAGNVTVQAVYDHLRLKFHLYRPIQTPACYGRKDVSFFGHFQLKGTNSEISVLKARDAFIMDAGCAHGVCKGDEFALYPLSTSKDPEQKGPSRNDKISLTRAIVEEVSGTNSKLKLMDILDPDLSNESRWIAKMLSLPTWKCPVRLSPISPADIERWTLEMAKKRFIVPSPEDDAYSSHNMEVIEIEGNKCRVLDAKGEPVRNLPLLPYSSNDRSFGKLANVLQHLATYEYVRAMANEAPIENFEVSFTACLTDKFQNLYSAGQTLEVKAGEKFDLTVTNHGRVPLYLTVFDMGPQWQISNLFAKKGEDFKVLAPYRALDETYHEHTGKVDIPLHTSIPTDLVEMGQHHCDDVIKVFVTSKATSFVSLVTEKLPLSAADYAGPKRGKKNSGDLALFLSSLALPSRGPSSDLPDENWTTRDFIVRTVSG